MNGVGLDRSPRPKGVEGMEGELPFAAAGSEVWQQESTHKCLDDLSKPDLTQALQYKFLF